MCLSDIYGVIIVLASLYSEKLTRAKERLNSDSTVKSKIKDCISECNLYNKKDTDSLIHRFIVIKKCLSDYDCKIHEALIIKNIN